MMEEGKGGKVKYEKRNGYQYAKISGQVEADWKDRQNYVDTRVG